MSTSEVSSDVDEPDDRHHQCSDSLVSKNYHNFNITTQYQLAITYRYLLGTYLYCLLFFTIAGSQKLA